MHVVDRRTLTAEILQGLGLRTRVTGDDFARPAERSVPHRLGLPFFSNGGPGANKHVGIDNEYPPPDLVRATDHNGRRCLEGETLPRLPAAGEIQPEGSRRPETPLNPPTRHHHQRRPPASSMDPAHHARVTAGSINTNATTNTTATTSSTAAAMLVDNGPSDAPVMIPSSSPSSGLDGDITAARYVGSGGGAPGVSGGFGSVYDYRGHPRASRAHARLTTNAGDGSPLRRTTWSGGARALGRRPLMSGGESGAVDVYGEGDDRDAMLVRGPWRQSPKDASQNPDWLSSTLAGGKRKRHPGCSGGSSGGGGVPSSDGLAASRPAGDGREHQHGMPSTAASLTPFVKSSGSYRHTTGPLPYTSSAPLPVEQGMTAGIDSPGPLPGSTRRLHCHSRTLSSGTTEAAAAMAMLGRPAFRGSGPGGWRVGEERPSREGDGSAPLGQGGNPGSGAGDRTRGVPEPGMGCGHDVRRHPQLPPPPDSKPNDHHLQPRPAFLHPLQTTITPPRSGRGVGGDHVTPGTPSRPSVSSSSGSAYPSPPLQGVDRVVATTEGREAGGDRVFPCDEVNGDSGRGREGAGEGHTVAGADSDPGASAHRGYREQQRHSNPNPAKPPTARKECMEDGCDRRARLAFKGNKKPAFCEKHGVVGMVDTRHPRCDHEQCTRQPSFGMEGDRRASYCAAHKKAGMVNVSSRRCEQAGCLRHPNFGFPGNRRALFCKEHLQAGMVDVVSRRCRGASCTRRPLYNMEGLRPVSCSFHKLPGMIDVVSARCQEPGCLRHPSFGYVSDMKARRCASHRLENMESVKGRSRNPRRKGNAATAAAAVKSTRF
eukprot:g7768.t1